MNAARKYIELKVAIKSPEERKETRIHRNKEERYVNFK